MFALARLASLAKTLNRASAVPLLAVFAYFGGGLGNASADVKYTSYTWIGDDIDILHPDNVGGGAGQITLKLNTGSTILAWCLDVFDRLQNSGTYSVTKNGPINGVTNPSNGGHIGALMLDGDLLIKADYTSGITVNGHHFSAADISAATQVAIWTAEYGVYSSGHPTGFSYQSLPGHPPLPADFSDLVSWINTDAYKFGNVTYFTLDPDPANCIGNNRSYCSYPTNQHLGYVAVPGPVTGAGLPGLLAGCAALLAFARRRRRAAA